jgi:hypothetical protein
MDGDLVGSGTFADAQCIERIGVCNPSGFPEYGDMVDIDTQ